MPETVAVVLHYENEAMTNQCVDSILKTAPSVKVLIVDNNSPTPYFSQYRSEDVEVVRNNNRYAVSGMNCGFLHALGLNPAYIMNFDNDIICMDGWYESLVATMKKDPRIGIVGGKQWQADMKAHRSVGSDLIGGHLYGNKPDIEMDVVWIQASAVMMRAEMMRRIGIHDERFKIVCSDSDYCLHAKDRGWRVVFVPDSNVIHIGGASYTSACESWTEDNKNLLRKWSGMAGMAMLNGFPLDTSKKQYLEAKFHVRED